MAGGTCGASAATASKEGWKKESAIAEYSAGRCEDSGQHSACFRHSCPRIDVSGSAAHSSCDVIFSALHAATVHVSTVLGLVSFDNLLLNIC